MNNDQKLLVNLLSCAIRGKKPDNIDCSGINWSSVFNEALSHNVHSLLLPKVKELDKRLQPDEVVFKQWNEHTIYSGYRQAIEIENMEHVLGLFNAEGIPVISLKGLVLRNLYPHPLLRTMSDADILIHREDFEKAQALLLSLGYYNKVDTNPKEVRFFHKTNMLIELHWLLIEPGYIKNSDQLERDAWNKKESLLLGNTPILTLSAEDNIIYLCMHMIMHFMYRGFGLRQLCDLVLLVEAKQKEINWSMFYKKLETFGMVKFVEYIFLVCQKLLNFEIPNKEINSSNKDTAFIELFVDDIFSSGVFGFKEPSRDYITRTIERFGHEPEVFPSKTSLYLKNIFPSRKFLSEQYKYVGKYPMLIPFAWIHRLFVSLFSGHFSRDFITHMRVPKGTKSEYAKRVKLLKEFNLR